MAARRSEPGRLPTLKDAQRTSHWLRLHRPSWRHHRAVTLARYVILWGPDEPVMTLRRLSNCSAGCHRGAFTNALSWGGTRVEFLSFPRGIYEPP